MGPRIIVMTLCTYMCIYIHVHVHVHVHVKCKLMSSLVRIKLTVPICRCVELMELATRTTAIAARGQRVPGGTTWGTVMTATTPTEP